MEKKKLRVYRLASCCGWSGYVCKFAIPTLYSGVFKGTADHLARRSMEGNGLGDSKPPGVKCASKTGGAFTRGCDRKYRAPKKFVFAARDGDKRTAYVQGVGAAQGKVGGKRGILSGGA